MGSLPCPPFVLVDGISNMRDLGGYSIPSSPNQSVRRGFLFRSADPSRATDAGKSQLTALGLTTIYDLRSEDEVARSALGAPIAVPGITRHFAPVFAEGDHSPGGLAARYRDYLHGGAAGFARAYRDILTSGAGAFGRVFAHVRDEPRAPLLFHCSAGKDRTGVLAMLVLALCGCADGAIADEYALTERGLEDLRAVIVRHVMEHPLLAGTDEAAALRMAGAKREYMLAALDMLREGFGGVEGYMGGTLGFSGEDVRLIRRNLLEDAVATL